MLIIAKPKLPLLFLGEGWGEVILLTLNKGSNWATATILASIPQLVRNKKQE
jgi:hypothetical protein